MMKRADLPANERLRSEPTDPIPCDVRKGPIRNLLSTNPQGSECPFVSLPPARGSA